MNNTINIIAFDIPYPPNYGGVIDVYYKIEKLKEIGYDIILHTYQYAHRDKNDKLNDLCVEVYYYERHKSISDFLSLKPFIVKTRIQEKLNERLRKNNYPIIFEGLHTTSPLLYDSSLYKRAYVRTHNIEHKFYYGLCKSERNLFKKLFFLSESVKLQEYEKILRKVKGVFSISPEEQKYFLHKYGNKSHYIPVFHSTETSPRKPTDNKFLLYHGDLRVSDNVKACRYLIHIFKNSSFKFVIASSMEKKCILRQVKKYDNISFKNISNNDNLNQLLAEAHINILLTFQKTGIKLKLMNCLYRGKHIIVNNKMVSKTGLEDLCHQVSSENEILKKTSELFQMEYNEDFQKQRSVKLKDFSPLQSAYKIKSVISDY